ncbi:MAG: three-Cys-motif partner protein TcmP [Candidatus Scalindua sp.]
MNPEDYIGREQTFIKLNLLKSYLERLFMIIGHHEKNISYVDCFAGPWQEGSDDLRDTSIAISLNIMQKCQEWLCQRGQHVQFRALYIEKDKESFERLESFLAKKDRNEVDANALRGEFHELRDDILKWCGEGNFTFFFVDHTGWRKAIEISTLRPLLQRQNSEYLINFMFDFVLRAHTQTQFEEQMKEIFGEVLDTTGMTPKEREVFFMKQYRKHLKSAQPSTTRKPRSAYAKVLYPQKDRTEYELVYLTRHPLGIVVFMEESEKLDLIQKKVRAQAKQDRRVEKSGQGEFSPAFTEIKYEDNKIGLSEVKDYWLSKLSDEPKQFGVEAFADMIEETDWFINDFQIAFKELHDEGKVENLDAENMERRKTLFVNYKADYNRGELLKRI